jgi:hypothetical protein
VPASFGSAVPAGVVNLRIPHQPGRYRKKMNAVPPVDRRAPGRSKIGLVHQGRALQGVVSTRFGETLSRDAPEFFVNQRDYALRDAASPWFRVWAKTVT